MIKQLVNTVLESCSSLRRKIDKGFALLPQANLSKQLRAQIRNVNHLRYSILLFCVFQINVLEAQNFTYKAKLQPVAKKGFHSIKLSSELSARAEASFADLRLFDQDGKEVPYLLKKEEAFQQESNITYYPILKNSIEGDWQIIIIQNEAKSSINKLLLEMKNADANRQVRISGSNDNSTWFVVKDNFEFSALNQGANSTQFNLLNFPLVDYEFYKIEIKNKNKNPLNIERIGYSNTNERIPNYQEVKGVSFTKKDSNKKTILHIECKPANRIDKLEFVIASPALYFRKAEISKEEKQIESNSYNSRAYSKELRTKNYQPHYSFELSSEGKSSIFTNEFLGYEKSSSFDIVIENMDSEPLNITEIKAFQLTTTLVAELKNNTSYFVYVGDSLLASPIYDLVYFSNKISDSLPSINIENVIPKSQKVEEEYSNANDKLLVWIGLGIVGIILLILTSSMLKKMNSSS